MCICILEVRELTFIVRRKLSWIHDQLHKTLNWSFDVVVRNDLKKKTLADTSVYNKGFRIFQLS